MIMCITVSGEQHWNIRERPFSRLQSLSTIWSLQETLFYFIAWNTFKSSVAVEPLIVAVGFLFRLREKLLTILCLFTFIVLGHFMWVDYCSTIRSVWSLFSLKFEVQFKICKRRKKAKVEKYWWVVSHAVDFMQIFCGKMMELQILFS